MSICAIVISYHPSTEIIENIRLLLGQVDEVVIVDNGSGEVTRALLARLDSYSRVSIIYNDENLGIATALNAGVKRAKAGGHEWIATFDQDSRVTPGMIPSMVQAYDACPEKESVAILCPRHKATAMGLTTSQAIKPGRSEKPLVAQALAVITSGNLVRTSIFDVVGYFNDALFIDYVDSEFCLRCADHGYKILEVQNAVLEHTFGFPVQHRLLWKTLVTCNYSPMRRYYSSRNRIWMYRQYAFSYPGWVIGDVKVFLKEVIMLVLFERDRASKLVAIWRGMFHGLVGRLGRL